MALLHFPDQNMVEEELREQGWSVDALLGFGGQERSGRHQEVQSFAQNPRALAHQFTAGNQLFTSSEIPQRQPFRLTIQLLLNFYTISAIVLIFFRPTYILLG